ncbi:uncharacterized protein [Prorops nasuta]|uniref:uncharacterized protein n=1 Tax=Prorops nasuta TaxID=863751 RepID=UPI0034CD17C8
MWNRKVFIRIVEVLLCISCVIALRVTDDESRRVAHYLRNISRQWFQLDNVTWGAIGAALAAATCGGYLIITAGLLIAAATGELKGRKAEIFMLGLGVILFGIVGGLSMASIESVSPDLVDNAAVFGALCLVTALVFIADILMSYPKDKKRHGTTQTFVDKDSGKTQVIPMVTTEKEGKPKLNGNARSTEVEEEGGNVNVAFERMDGHRGKMDDRDGEFQEIERHSSRAPLATADEFEEDRNRKFDHVERQLREYAQNFENGLALRDSQRYRDEKLHGKQMREPYEKDRRFDESRISYRGQDIFQRPVDEVDTPRFPVSVEKTAEPMFARVVNPAVKIMRVDREVDDHEYRYSDNSQYDNVPTRIRGTSPGILKKSRDVSFNVPPPPKSYSDRRDNAKDDIQILEESFSSLRTISTGTQTGVRLPSSPTDPGYVRHTASNWPQDRKTKTPGSSPERDTRY